MKKHLGKTGKQAKKLYIPKERENDFILLEPYPNIELSPKDAFKNKIFGLEIIWDAKEFKVE